MIRSKDRSSIPVRIRWSFTRKRQVALHLLPVFPVHEKHSKALAVLPAQVLVVHLVRAADGLGIGLGQAQRAHLALLHQALHRADGVLDRHSGVEPSRAVLAPPSAVWATMWEFATDGDEVVE